MFCRKYTVGDAFYENFHFTATSKLLRNVSVCRCSTVKSLNNKTVSLSRWRPLRKSELQISKLSYRPMKGYCRLLIPFPQVLDVSNFPH